MYTGERIDVRIEVEDNAVVLVLPRLLDDLMVRWEEAMQLGQIMELAAQDVSNEPAVIDPVAVGHETGQVKLNRHGKHVVLIFQHTDRVRLSPEAARIVAAAIKKTAQDVSLAQRDVHMVYGRKGLLTKVVNQKLGYTQHVR